MVLVVAGAGLFGAVEVMFRVGGRWIARESPAKGKTLVDKRTVVFEAEAGAECRILEETSVLE